MITARSIPRPGLVLCAASLAGLTAGAAGCKFPELPAIETDAAVDHSVGGTVEGLWTGADLVSASTSPAANRSA